MSPEQYDRLKYFDLENYETVRGLTPKTYIKKRLEKKFGINRKSTKRSPKSYFF